MKNKKHKYFVRHEVLAVNAMDARKQSLKREPDEVYRAEPDNEGGAQAIGFHATEPVEDY